MRQPEASGNWWMASRRRWRRPAGPTTRSRENWGALIGNHLAEKETNCVVVPNAGTIPRIRADANFRIPDLAVTCSDYEQEEYDVTEPLLLVEILSPANKAETWTSVWAYTTMPSVRRGADTAQRPRAGGTTPARRTRELAGAGAGDGGRGAVTGEYRLPRSACCDLSADAPWSRHARAWRGLSFRSPIRSGHFLSLSVGAERRISHNPREPATGTRRLDFRSNRGGRIRTVYSNSPLVGLTAMRASWSSLVGAAH